MEKQLGPYAIGARLGAGGMGEVFRAIDTRLGRTVAIKIIPTHLAAREDLRRRFEIEARAISSLSHPHICALYDIGEQDGTAYMVMEYLEGELLSARLLKGPMELAEALPHAIDIADALEQAHRRNIVHRDIKPANIMLTSVGVKLLDFGLAQLRERSPEIGGNDLTLSMTREGTILGTPQYMAPEQIEGKEADTRSDIFAFGSVLYEMLSGRRAFPGSNISEVTVAIARAEPPPPLESVPAALNRTLRICWARDPNERWQSAGDLRRELAWIAETAKSDSPVTQQTQRLSRREMFAWGTAAVFAATGAAEVIRGYRTKTPVSHPVRFTVTDSPPGIGMNLFAGFPAISPDGKNLAFVAGAGNQLSIWIRAMDSPELRELPESKGANGIFWSPDSRSVAFFSGDKLKRVAISGGPGQPICDTPIGSGGTWNDSGMIVFQHGRDGALHQVSAAGGASSPVTSLTPGDIGHLFPSFLPDGRTFLYTLVSGQAEKQGVYAASLDSNVSRRLSPLVANAVCVDPGYLLLGQGSKLMAQRFDSGRLQTVGDPFSVAGDVWSFQSFSAFGVSKSGVLVYAEAQGPKSQLTWFDRTGKLLEAVGPSGPFIHMDLSKDERHVLLERYEGNSGELWTLDLARGVVTPLTHGPGWAFSGFWSPDGSHFVFSLGVDASIAIIEGDINGSTQSEVLNIGQIGPGAPSDWSAASRTVVFTKVDPRGRSDLWSIPMVGGRQPVPYLEQQFSRSHGRISEDGRWMAYVSWETGAQEIYVSPFPNPTGRWRVSSAGGVQPKWRADGKELFYIAPDRALMAAPIPSTPDQAGKPVTLFRTDTAEYFGGARNDYSPSTDGKRFLVNTRIGGDAVQSLNVIVGWHPESK